MRDMGVFPNRLGVSWEYALRATQCKGNQT